MTRVAGFFFATCQSHDESDLLLHEEKSLHRFRPGFEARSWDGFAMAARGILGVAQYLTRSRAAVKGTPTTLQAPCQP